MRWDPFIQVVPRMRCIARSRIMVPVEFISISNLAQASFLVGGYYTRIRWQNIICMYIHIYMYM